ncbi:hypothetical protein CDV36_002174 [Fusarium kuroshium]|uniref:Uncharacterized protein n=1 Tax=Fusarium kuroshium TaxID=2010991 RepID=A0A3M2SM18_9HYPO|nr:hypothetical protein CDV36_002174 [Fusarium kuroshium]
MPGLLGTPTLAKMSINAAGRVWRRLKAKAQKKKQEVPEEAPEEVAEDVTDEVSEDVSEEVGHTFYSNSSDSIGYTDSDMDTLECVETIQEWINTNSDTYDFFGAWRHPSEPSSIASFDEEADLYRSVSVRCAPEEDAELVEGIESVEPAEPVVPIVPILPIKPGKRTAIKNVFKNVKTAFKRNSSG